MWEAPWKSFAILFLSLAVREKKEDYALFYWSQRYRPHKKEEVLRSITLPLHGKNKWLSNSSIQKKTGPNNGTKVVSKEAIRMQQTGALLWLYAWRNEAGNPTLQLYHQKSEEHEHWCTMNDKPKGQLSNRGIKPKEDRHQRIGDSTVIMLRPSSVSDKEESQKTDE